MKRKNKILLTTVFIIAILIIVTITSVNALPINDLAKDNWVLNHNSVTDEYYLTKNWTGTHTDGKEVHILSGDNVVINLNGKNLTNYEPSCEVISIAQGGTLTIRGAGNVSLVPTSTYCVIKNEGTLIIEDGIFETNLKENSIIENYGTLTIKGGTFQTTTSDVLTDKIHTVIFNDKKGTLNIEGGTFKTNTNNSVISNFGTLNISGGTVSSGMSLDTLKSSGATEYDHYLIENAGKVTISGEATITKPESVSAAIGNIPQNEGESVTGEINVKGGNLESSFNLIQTNGGTVNVESGKLTTKNEGHVVVNNGGTLNVSGGTLTAEQATDGAILVTSNEAKVNITGGDVKASNASQDIFVNEGLTPEVEVSEDVGRLGTVENEDEGIFKTTTGKQVIGKYSDIKFKFYVDNKEVSNIELEEGKVAKIKVVALLGDDILDSKLVLTSNSAKVATVKESADGYEVTAVSEGKTTLTVSLGKAIATLNLNVNAIVVPEDPDDEPEADDNTIIENAVTDNEVVDNTVANNEADDGVVPTGDYIVPVVAVLLIVIAANVVYFVRKRKINK